MITCHGNDWYVINNGLRCFYEMIPLIWFICLCYISSMKDAVEMVTFICLFTNPINRMFIHINMLVILC